MISSKKIRKEIIDEVATENNFAKMDIALIYKQIFRKIREKCRDLKDGEGFTIVGFAKFKAMNRVDRIARNPKTKEEYQIPNAKNIKIKVTGGFHKFVNGLDSGTEEDDEDV
jgi:nucleoid DNA-binding protein